MASIERRIANLEALATKLPSPSSGRIDLSRLTVAELEELRALRLLAGPTDATHLDKLDDAELCRLQELYDKARTPLAPGENLLT